MQNETVASTVFKTYNVIFKESIDPRVKDWYGFGHPFGLIAVLSIYLYLVCVYLPEYMKDKKPYNLQRVIRVYNLFQVVACGGIVYRIFKNGWSLQMSLEPMTYISTQRNDEFLYISLYNFGLKFVDLLETIFFVLRHKQSQVTRLHLYHHCSTLFFGWYITQYLASGVATFTIIINSSVHVLMYAYYFVSTLGPEAQRKMRPVKSKLTMVQMVQFWLLAIHSITYMKYNKGMLYTVTGYLFISNLIVNFTMFLNFYMKSYKKAKTL